MYEILLYIFRHKPWFLWIVFDICIALVVCLYVPFVALLHIEGTYYLAFHLIHLPVYTDSMFVSKQ